MKVCKDCGTINLPKYEICQKCCSENLKSVEYKNRPKPKEKQIQMHEFYGARQCDSKK